MFRTLMTILISLSCTQMVRAADHIDALLAPPCDSIKLLDGGVILGNIFYEDRLVIRYTHCNEDISTKHDIQRHLVKEVVYGSNKHNEPFVENKTRLNNRGIYLIIIGAAIVLAGLVVVLTVL
ncbi:MAG: hypothetical protein HUJ25_07680 [Crocinitomicaceae bacterium]|nr:hypothetical protein [Crocinitomicaceae bacterium]